MPWGKTIYCIEGLVCCMLQSLRVFVRINISRVWRTGSSWLLCLTCCHASVAPSFFFFFGQVITITLQDEKKSRTETTSCEASLILPDKATSVRVISGRWLCLFSMGIVTWVYFSRLNYPDTFQSPWIYHFHPSPGSATKAITLGPNQ